MNGDSRSSLRFTSLSKNSSKTLTFSSLNQKTIGLRDTFRDSSINSKRDPSHQNPSQDDPQIEDIQRNLALLKSETMSEVFTALEYLHMHINNSVNLHTHIKHRVNFLLLYSVFIRYLFDIVHI